MRFEHAIRHAMNTKGDYEAIALIVRLNDMSEKDARAALERLKKTKAPPIVDYETM